tara:strand:+ start:1122 stop:1970 length:849 start_codon:yes stop_codon:yes gene_type:complete
MSGVSGSNRINRKDFVSVLNIYRKEVLEKIPGFISVSVSGSFESNQSKADFGDMDLIVQFRSNDNKKDLKKSLVKHFGSLSDDVIIPFSSDKYRGRKSYNSGEIVTVSFPQPEGTVQIDNIIALSPEEVEYKKRFLDLPAPKQGLLAGVVRTSLFEKGYSYFGLIRPSDAELEFVISSKQLQLREVSLEMKSGSLVESSRKILSTTMNWDKVELITPDYDWDLSFEDLVEQVRKNITNIRSLSRIVGLFKSQVTVKSGEIGTPKAKEKEESVKLMETLLINK